MTVTTDRDVRVPGADGTWEAGSNFSVQVTGPVLKKDGTAGKQTYQGSPPWGYWDDPRYAWLVDIVNLGRPTGRIAMLAVDGAIIPDPA